MNIELKFCSLSHIVTHKFNEPSNSVPRLVGLGKVMKTNKNIQIDKYRNM